MTPRIANPAKAAPDVYQAMMRLEQAVAASGLEHSLLELLKIRVSQINGCAYCIDMHSRDLIKGGMPLDKLVLVPVWHEAGELFGKRERAALAWAESVTRVEQTGIPDSAYEAASAEFNEKELADLTYAIGLMNAFNRFGVAFRSLPAAASV